MRRILVLPFLPVLLWCSFSLAQDEVNPDEARTRYLLVEEYAEPPSSALETLRQKGLRRFSLPVVDRPSRPEYDIELELNKGNGSYYKLNEELFLTFTPRRECYVLIYDIQPDGQLNILFPNSGSNAEGRVVAGRQYRIPSSAGTNFQVQRPFGIDFVQAVASATPIDFHELHLGRTEGSILIYKQTAESFLVVNALRKHLGGISERQWASKEVFFITHPRLSDPTKRQWAEYNSTGRGIVFDDVPEGRRSFVIHNIVWGDTLSAISLRYLGKASLYPRIARDNGIVNPHRIYAGDTVRVYTPIRGTGNR